MDISLSKSKCKPCTGDTPKLSENEIKNLLKHLDNWNINNDKEMIFKKFNFSNFKKSLKFVNIVGELAEKEGHHPDLSIGWGYCLVMIHTHAIKGLSKNDFVLASKIDLIEKN